MAAAYTLDDDVLQLNFSPVTGGSERAEFNFALAAGPCSMPERVRVYTSAKSAKADFDAGLISAEQYRAVTDAFAQVKNKPTRVYVGRVDYSVAKVTTIALTGTDDGAWTVTLGGTDYTFTASGSTTDDAGAGLQSAIAASDDYAASFDAGTDVLTITGLKGDDYTVVVASPNSNLGAPTTTTAAVSVDDELDEVLAENEDWFGFSLVDTSPDDRDVEIAALWGQANARLYQQQSSAVSLYAASDDLSTRAQDLEIFGGFVWFHDSADEQYVFALLAERLTGDPDSTSVGFSNVPLVGFTPSTLTPTQAANLRAKGIGFYSKVLGTSVTSSVQAIGNNKVRPDNLIGMWWARARIREDWANLAIQYAQTQRKIPYTDQGFQLVASPVRRRLQQGVDIGHFEGEPRIKVPSKASLEGGADAAAKRVPITAAVVNQDGVEQFKLDAYGFNSTTELNAVFGEPST